VRKTVLQGEVKAPLSQPAVAPRQGREGRDRASLRDAPPVSQTVLGVLRQAQDDAVSTLFVMVSLSNHEPEGRVYAAAA